MHVLMLLSISGSALMSIVTMELVLSLLVAAATIAVFIRTRRMAALAKGEPVWTHEVPGSP